MISALDVAWYFVQKGEGDPSITQLKLQKLCYYAQGFYLAVFGEPLFYEAIEAWDYGPVVVELRQVHSHRGAETISPDELAFGDLIQTSVVTEHLDRVWGEFGHYSAGELVDLTHAESPWIEAYRLGQNTRISENAMKNYFLSIKDKIWHSDNSCPEDVLMANVFLKDGKEAKVPFDQVERFLEDNKDLLESRKMEVRGKRRSSDLASNKV
jgi:uncharacterized phage-associated protein